MKPLVLVVEDEAALQQLLAYNLERAGFAVEQALDADEALTLIAERTPDLVLLDWMLPWTSGLELCRQLRRKPATANLPIIMLTARTEEPDRLQGLDTGADDYITKPFSIEELIARVRAVLRRVRPAFAAEVLRFADLTMDLAASCARSTPPSAASAAPSTPAASRISCAPCAPPATPSTIPGRPASVWRAPPPTSPSRAAPRSEAKGAHCGGRRCRFRPPRAPPE
jgi:CheY-like chemotaxis protein